MPVFCIPAGTYLTNISSTPMVGTVTRDLLSLLADVSYWTWRNPHWLKLDSNFSGNFSEVRWESTFASAGS